MISLNKKIHRPYLLSILFVCAGVVFWKRISRTSIDCQDLMIEGVRFFKHGEYDKALNCYQQIIYHDPSISSAYFNMAQLYAKKGNIDEAIIWYKKVLQQNDSARYVPLAHYQLGTLLHQQRNLEDAKKHLMKAAELCAEYVPALLSLGRDFRNSGALEYALSCFDHAHHVAPWDVKSILFLADTIHIMGRVKNDETLVEKALTYYQKACFLDPMCHSAHHNCGLMFSERGDNMHAIEYFKKALQSKPQDPSSNFCLGTCYLQQGNYKEGFPLYEWRWQIESRKTFSELPLWDGSSLQNKSIIVHAEQGFGDVFQFIRYLPMVNKCVGTVYFMVYRQLKEIVSLCPFVQKVVTFEDAVPAADFQISLMSLPLIFKTEPSTIPTEIPYLFADGELTSLWKKKLAQDTNFKIGICWQCEKSHDFMGYRGASKIISVQTPKRSIPLAILSSLAQLPGVSLYSLQKGTNRNEFARLPKDVSIKIIPHLDEKNGRFMDAAALMKNLDLVITIDTSIVHLAGGLGVPAWVLLPHVAEWRWLIDRSDTPWYPTIKLFRQPKPGDWESVIKKMSAELTALIQKKL